MVENREVERVTRKTRRTQQRQCLLAGRTLRITQIPMIQLFAKDETIGRVIVDVQKPQMVSSTSGTGSVERAWSTGNGKVNEKIEPTPT